MKKRILSICIIFFSIFFVGIIGIFISISNSHNLTDDDTIEFVGTVSDKKLVANANNSGAEIYIEEYECYLYLNSVICDNIDLNDIQNLQAGDTIIFRIEKKQEELLYTVNSFCSIVSLSTENKDIFSLSEYNKYMRDSLLPTKIAAVVVSIIFLLADICSIILFKKNQGGTA